MESGGLKGDSPYMPHINILTFTRVGQAQATDVSGFHSSIVSGADSPHFSQNVFNVSWI